MKTQLLAIAFLAVGLGAAAVAASPHHGTAASYDLDTQVVLEGAVTEFVWLNPHSQLYLDVKDDDGNTVNWAVEMGSPGVLTRAGWTKNMFKAGDRVTITVNPSPVGAPVGLMCLGRCQVLLNGREIERPDAN